MMLADVRVPKLQEPEPEPYVGRWFKTIGEAVTTGEPIVEIFQGTGRTEISAPATGYLTEIRLSDGQFVESNSLLGRINTA
jgi:2-oxoglutarate dehydrogenase E2 component (dihydrolipoamide succinyltransferase)